MDLTEPQVFLKLLKQRDNQAYKILYSQYFVALKNLALFYLKDDQVSVDVVQDTFFSLLESNKIFESVDQVKFFLFASLKNKCISYIRKINVRTNAEEEVTNVLYPFDMYWENVLEEDVYSRLLTAIQTLPPQCKLVMQYSLEGLKNSEIAEKMNISTETVKDHKANGKKKLKEWFKNSDMLLLIYFLLI